jgi:hypothetical protein
VYKIYPYNYLYRISEKEIISELLATLEDMDVDSSIDKIFKENCTDRSLINVIMRVFPMGSERGNLAMSISESILRTPDNGKKNEIVSQFKLPIPIPASFKRVCAQLSVNVLSKTLISGSKIEKNSGRGLSSYDMLGESAITMEQANDCFEKYKSAAYTVELKQSECIPFIIERVSQLMEICQSRGIGLTIDAEESDRLDLSMMVIEAIVEKYGEGLIVAVQANQKRASGVIQYLNSLGSPVGVRLVKGAYWDTEIKLAQERGVDYPVFTSKENTNISYLACSKLMLECKSIIPKFATHNPSTVGAVLGLTDNKLEFQRLFGMGDKLHKLVEKMGHLSRVYKPIGTSKDLLAYLIRRMMENGANTSFVMHEEKENHKDEGAVMESYKDLYSRTNSSGLDFSDPEVLNELEVYFEREDT